MQRVLELIQEVITNRKSDDFFQSFESDLENWDLKKQYFKTLNNALVSLDIASWQLLKNKALKHYNDYRIGQKKQGFFNQLSEAFAYQHLASLGYTDIKILAEDKNKKTPDLSYVENGKKKYCEVKTVGISDDEIERREAQGIYVDRQMYSQLSTQFFQKLDKDLEVAREQINAKGEGIVFVLIRLDDYADSNMNKYREQITSFVDEPNPTKLVIKIESTGEVFSNLT